MNHPAQYSPEVIDALRGLIKPGEWIHDPFAGTGVRLGKLCDEIGADFTGSDIEDWPDKDDRVELWDSTSALSYPGTYAPGYRFTIATSCVYLNKRLCDYPEGPKETTKVKGRRDYGIALGRPLHPENLARWTGKPSKAAEYWRRHALALQHWGERVLLNVDLPIAQPWTLMLLGAGYQIEQTIPVYTQRDRSQQHTDGYAEYEVIIEAIQLSA